MKREDLSAFATRLRLFRRQQKLTQADVAARLNLHRTTYTKYENDKATPDPECLLSLANLFGVSVDRLLGQAEAVPALNDDGFRPELDPAEQNLVYEFRRLTPEQKQQILQQVQGLKNKEP